MQGSGNVSHHASHGHQTRQRHMLRRNHRNGKVAKGVRLIGLRHPYL